MYQRVEVSVEKKKKLLLRDTVRYVLSAYFIGSKSEAEKADDFFLQTQVGRVNRAKG